MSHIWIVRAGEDNEIARFVEEKKAIAIGWFEIGDLTDITSRGQLRARYTVTYPDHSTSRTNVNIGQLYRFVREINEGEVIATIIQESREILIGKVAGPYKYDPSLFEELGPSYPNTRKVEWIKKVSRDEFSQPAKYSLGSVLTVFTVDPHRQEFSRIISGQPAQQPALLTEQVAPPFHEDVRAKADTLIADRISQLDGYQFQDLVAAVLRSMGYHAISSKPGRDKGIDIVAYPDSLGFAKPRIKVQVKHKTGQVSGPEMQSFIGALRPGDNGMYVSTGGFSSDAISHATTHHEPIATFNREEFIKLLVDHYDQLESDYKGYIPLTKVWIPIE